MFNQTESGIVLPYANKKGTIMEKRSPITVALLTIVTLGIYGIIWYVKTKREMNKLGADIPTVWLIIIPIVGLYWLWKYSEGVEKVTNGKLSAILCFILMYLVGFVGIAVVQDSFNKIGEVPMATATATPAPVMPASPIPTTDTPTASMPTADLPSAPAVPTDPTTPPTNPVV